MTEIEVKLDAEPKNDYEKTKKLLLETDRAIRALPQEQQQQLAYEFVQYKGLYDLFQMI